MSARSQIIITGFDSAGLFAGLVLPARFRKRQAETRFKQEWKLTWQQYLIMMREFINPEYQRGSIILATAAPAGIHGGVLITNHTITAISFTPANATAGVRWDTDGQISRNRNTVYDNPFSNQWWSNEPVTGIGSSYAVRALSGGSGTWTVAAAVDNTWITMSANREWNVLQTVIGIKTTTRVFEVGPQPTGPVHDSGSITCTAEEAI